MPKSVIVFAAVATLGLAACGSGSQQPTAPVSEASLDDSVNLKTDIAPSVEATGTAPTDAAAATLPATASPTPEASGTVAPK